MQFFPLTLLENYTEASSAARLSDGQENADFVLKYSG